MNDDYERLQLQTKKKYVLDTFRNGLRCIQDDSKVAQKFVFLCLALAVVALFFASGSSGNDVLSVVFRPIIYAVYAIAWLAECIGVILVFGYLPHSWAYYDDFTRAGIYNQAREAPLLIKASRDGNIQQLTYYIKGYPLECWEDNRTRIESALNVTILSITQGSNNQLFELRVVAGCNLMGRLIPWADTYMDDSDTKIVLGICAKIKSAPDVPFHCNLCWIMFIRTSSKTIRNNSIYGTKSSVTNGTGSPSPVSKFRLSTNWPPIIKLTPKR